mmetsp:Transcript_20477/g.49576  ORF Transcript_20477/g.49576 Transcript_20477/m.49576 type:complete len:104 (-) Transcript_20477:2131-2442(-)
MSSLCVPDSTIWPRSSTTILSAFWTVERRCAITIVVRFDAPPIRSSTRRSRASCTTSSDLLSSAAVASSRRRTRGSRTIARAIATRCRCPPESWFPREPQLVE